MAEPEHPDGPENRIIPRKQPPLHHRALAILWFFRAPIASGTKVSGPASILWVQSRDLKVLTLLPKYRQEVQYIRSGVRTEARKGNVGDWQVPGFLCECPCGLVYSSCRSRNVNCHILVLRLLVLELLINMPLVSITLRQLESPFFLHGPVIPCPPLLPYPPPIPTLPPLSMLP
jgi:hypothetical protein